MDCHCPDCGSLWTRHDKTQSRYCSPCKEERKRIYYSTNMEGRAKKMASDARRRAEKAGVPFALPVEWILGRLEAGRCELSDLPFDLKIEAHGRGPRKPFVPSIDRVLPRMGYVPKNCRMVLVALNMAIGPWGDGITEHIMRSWIERIDDGRRS